MQTYDYLCECDIPDITIKLFIFMKHWDQVNDFIVHH